MMNYHKEKREKKGQCNICGKESELTYDHVPPKSCFNSYKTEYRGIFSKELNTYKDNLRYEITQNGIKFRSICEKCNKVLLGGKYDPELSKLIYNIDKKIQLGDKGSAKLIIDTKINKVVRSIIGHFLAAKNDFDDMTKVDKKLRYYFLNSKITPPNKLKLLYYFYPFEEIMIVRDIVVSNPADEIFCLPDGLISCISCYPIAFILSSGEESCGLNDMFHYCTKGIDDVISLEFNLESVFHNNGNIIRHPYWPSNISDVAGPSMVFGGKYMEHSVQSIRRKILKK